MTNIEIPERVSYDSLTGEEVSQDVLKHLETQTGTNVVLECSECGMTWNCHLYKWGSGEHAQRCYKCGSSSKTVTAVGWLE